MDVRIAHSGDHFRWRPVPLALRRPAVVSAVGGWIIASGGIAGGLAGAVTLAGISVSLPVLASGTLFIATCLVLGIALSPAAQRTGSVILGTVLSAGHAILFLALCAAMALPALRTVLAPYNAQMPYAHLTVGAPAFIAEVAALYVASFTVYSVLAPLSLIIFRYTALTKRS